MNDHDLRIVSVLCAAHKTAYKSMAAVEVYDRRRDARTFAGDTPIVAHPPCRGWSLRLRHMAKPEPGEMELGLWCCDQLRNCGGVLEQPAHSLLFEAGQLPWPRQHRGDLWTIQVDQFWWGYPLQKKTWLCFAGIDPSSVQLPLRLRPRNSTGNNFETLSKRQRSETIPAFAEFLVDLARSSGA